MEAARRRAVRDLRCLADAAVPPGAGAAVLRRHLATLRARVSEIARTLAGAAPPPPPPRDAPPGVPPAKWDAVDPAKVVAGSVADGGTGGDVGAAAPGAVPAAAGRLAEAVYRAGERLFATVDADHREAGERRPAPLDATSLAQFRRALAAATHRVRRCLAALDAAAEPAEDSDGDDDAGGRAAAAAGFAALQSCWTRHRRERRDPPRGSPETRSVRRLHAHPPCARTGCVVCRRRVADAALVRRALGGDDEAGPRALWAAVARPAPDATPADLEARLWRAALLVRCHQRRRGLRLNRDEAQRKLLDLRCYELVLAYVRAAD